MPLTHHNGLDMVTLHYSCNFSEICFLNFFFTKKRKKVASVSQLVEGLLSMQGALGSILSLHEPGARLCQYQGVKSEESEVQGQPRLHKSLSLKRIQEEKESVQNSGRLRRCPAQARA